MGSHVIDVLRQGIWASLTGGWFYDPHQSVFCNTFHLYLWLFLLLLPLTFSLVFASNLITWIIYCVLIGVLFVLVKSFNFRLHHMFDTTDATEEPPSRDNSEASGREELSQTAQAASQSAGKETSEGIEMSVLSSEQGPASTNTPPVQCSSRNSVAEMHRMSRPRPIPTPADSMDYINTMLSEGRSTPPPASSIKDVQVQAEVHHKNSLEPSGATGVSPCHSLKSLSSSGSMGPNVLRSGTHLAKGRYDNRPGSEGHTPYGSKGDNLFLPRNRDRPSLEIFNEAPYRGHVRRQGAVRRARSSVNNASFKRKGPPNQTAMDSDLSEEALVCRTRKLSLPVESPTSFEAEEENEPISKKGEELPSASNKPEDVAENAGDGPEVRATLCEPERMTIEDSFGSSDVAYVLNLLNDSEKECLPITAEVHMAMQEGLSCQSLKDMEAAEKGTSDKNKRTSSDECDPYAKDCDLTLSPVGKNFQEPQAEQSYVEADIAFLRTDSSLPDSAMSESKTMDESDKGAPQLLPPGREPARVTFVEASSDEDEVDLRKVKKRGKHKHKHRLPFHPPDHLRHHLGLTQSPANSQDSGSMGLSELFHSDSDSSLSLSVPHDHSMTSSSTLTNEDDYSFTIQDSKTRSKYPKSPHPSHRCRVRSHSLEPKQHEKRSKSTKSEHRRTTSVDGSVLCEGDRKLQDDDDVTEAAAERDKRSAVTTEEIGGATGGGESPSEASIKKLLENFLKCQEQHQQGTHAEADFDKPERSASEKRHHSRGRRSHTRSRGRHRHQASLDQSPERMKADPEKASSSRESSASNHNESSVLLRDKQPSTSHSRHSGGSHLRRISHSSAADSEPGPDQVPADMLEAIHKAGGHVAQSHDDYSSSAVHCFQDEHGVWRTYTFGGDNPQLSSLISQPLTSSRRPPMLRLNQDRNVLDSSSESTVVIENPPSHSPGPPPSLGSSPQFANLRNYMNMSSNEPFMDSLFSQMNRGSPRFSLTSSHTHDLDRLESKQKFYYRMKLLCTYVKVRLDRLGLMALLDRNTTCESVISVLLAVIVAVLGSVLLSHSFYKDIWAVIFCFVIASCQYSLVKSVQPDAASPMHGYNRLVVFGRPVYFCICASLVLILHYASQNWTITSFTLYGIPFTSKTTLEYARDVILIFMLCFPVIFTLGLLPQIDTFMMFVLEQLEIHVFGGYATTSLISAMFTITRSSVCIGILFGFCYAAIKNPPVFQEQNNLQHVVFSVYCGVLVPIAYHLSRSSSDPTVLWNLLKSCTCCLRRQSNGEEDKEITDPLPERLKEAVVARLNSDLVVGIASMVLVFAVSVSTAFGSPALQPTLHYVLVGLTGTAGLLNHYVLFQFRKETPWLYFSHPIMPNHERSFFEVQAPAKIMWFERFYIGLRFVARNFFHVALTLSAATLSTPTLLEKFSLCGAGFVICICCLKMLRCGFCDAPTHYFTVILTLLFFEFDTKDLSETFLIDYFFMAIFVSKGYEMFLKWKFILLYIAPWQIPWGSAFHAFGQPFSIPHSAMLVMQTLVSSFFSAPLNPLLGSAIFLTSYVRPVKFWEKNYNTKRVDVTTTKLSNQIDRDPGSDDNNLNSIFYEHLTRSLQTSLCGDLQMGRWGPVYQGDCFIMASDYLNALVHIIELGNGLVTFQLRGLEFRGTYCQQREVEAITEGVEDDSGLCCCEPGHLPHCLSLNVAFGQRWMAWEVLVAKYVVQGYSVTENNAAPLIQMYELRKILLRYYVKSIIYYTIRSPRLEEWLSNDVVRDGLEPTTKVNYVDADLVFSETVDDDYDAVLGGVSRRAFWGKYENWIDYCCRRREQVVVCTEDSPLASLCFGLSILGRRVLASASHNNYYNGVEFFLYGLHALFKGDFRISSPKDEWIFGDMDILRRVVSPGVRMSLKLDQDHFITQDEFPDDDELYATISNYETTMVISHEADPQWRNAVLSNVPSLLALRHNIDEGSDQYKIVMLNMRYLGFRVIKVNKECVRGFWAGQQQELIFFRNRNPERGSIQNAKQALRNMINSSCDQPIGYPIYVSPLTTSYAGNNTQYSSMLGKELSFQGLCGGVQRLWGHMTSHCGAHCTQRSSSMEGDATCGPGGSSNIQGVTASVDMRGAYGTTPDSHLRSYEGSNLPVRSSLRGACGGSSLSSHGATSSAPFQDVSGDWHWLQRYSVSSTASGPSSGKASLKRNPADDLGAQAKILDHRMVLEHASLRQGNRWVAAWPKESWRVKATEYSWGNFTPKTGMIGTIIHRWEPGNPDPVKRSTMGKVIVLLRIDDHHVPILEHGIRLLPSEV